MALGAPYITTAVFKSQYLKLDTASDDDEIDDVLDEVSEEIESHTGRQFNDAGSATLRRFYREDAELVYVDDFHTTAGLVIATDEDDDGVAETTWSASDYQLEPLNGVVEGQPGWPFWTIRAVGDKRFPLARRATVHVTAQWGWAAVPPRVVQACKILAAETLKLRDAPLGVAGFGDFGVVRVRDNPKAANKLAPLVRTPVLAVAREDTGE
ncbi:hypothetical protein [Prauserella muralis]|uniref:Uncharacterized protein n=1 Tax=Prauserella muralis TaxID=588067 RepID=A0A2V4APS4_9PSEU|nr:hypothetical protein [Prauserella muralis]PXY21126.1 hypothetical protein BAY60_27045 [Prauserella muralis]TWE30214.1 hypothetical protein FHX69_2911 [Prauserella muralis]